MTTQSTLSAAEEAAIRENVERESVNVWVAIADRRTLLRALDEMRKPCVWKYCEGADEGGQRMDLGCGGSVAFDDVEGAGFEFCPYCGHPIAEAT